MRQLGQHVSQEELQDMANEVDPEGNGTIDLADFSALMTRRLHEFDSSDELLEVFKVFDRQGKTYITGQDLLNVMTNFGEKFSQEEVDEMLREANADIDGHVSIDQFLRMTR